MTIDARDFQHVFTPGRIGTLDLPHRIVMGAMHLGTETGDVDDLVAFYRERVEGGAGLIVTGGAAVDPFGAGGPGYAVLTRDADRRRLATLAQHIRRAGGLLALQLFHAGRYALLGEQMQPVAPSPVFSRFAGREPRAMTADDIEATLDHFVAAAEFAANAGFAAVEVMASEGYLINEFLAPATNLRDDDWGGDPERRRRFGVEVARRIRAALGPDFPLIVRISGADLVEGGTPAEDVDAFAAALVEAGVDALNVGIGWHESPVPTVQTVVPHGVWLPIARRIKAVAGGCPVIAGNRVNRLDQAEACLARGDTDFVSMARPFLADPGFIAKHHAGRAVNVCIACNQACIDRSLVDERVSCLVNPRAGWERRYPAIARDTAGRGPVVVGSGGRGRVVVVGGGPAGLQAAIRLAEHGVDVELFEAAPELGGQFRLARNVPGKADYGRTIDYCAARLAELGVAVHLNSRIAPGDVAGFGDIDAIVIATGVHPRPLHIPGVTLPFVLDYSAAFDAANLGRRVVIVGGGGIAVDAAHFAAAAGDTSATDRFCAAYGLGPILGSPPTPEPGDISHDDIPREVTIVHRSRRLGARLGRSSRWVVLGELRHAGVQILHGAQYERIDGSGLHIVDESGHRRELPADTIVVAVGQEPNNDLVPAAAAAGLHYEVIGGARDVDGLDAVRAFAEGLAAADRLAARLTEQTPARPPSPLR